MKLASVLDYGAGNVKSLSRALIAAGYDRVQLIDQPEQLNEADNLYIPGVGSFSSATEKLQSNGLFDAVLEHANSGKPLIGICLGMQLLATSGNEFGVNPGLGLIDGTVDLIPDVVQGRNVLPVINWIDVKLNTNPTFNLDSCKDPFYFVHSYYFKLNNERDLVAYYERGNSKIAAIVQKDNVIGFQFHPEKSGLAGIKLLKNTMSI
ncbi:imidazole glycerol phosphate synthase subunit HisH [Aliamphritea hakodatensis]|uniref:imidazole glycerol phosphate synthase subunit HisH n=1 Tax=Aliamphritea hakodatensis TaxID=2895352 RepID=UPI0022FDA701|nr:imidazole glycerol phosphate synthase subunit HisH [Aliamphritea hakodatensis]